MTGFATADSPVWDEIASRFARHEFKRPDQIAERALLHLFQLRNRSGVPGRVVSDARDGNAGVSLRGGVSAHDERPSTAFDLRVHSAQERYAVALHAFAGNAMAAIEEIASGRATGDRARLLAIRALQNPGYPRIGIYPPTDSQRLAYGKNSGSIHVDESTRLPQKVCWVSV